MAKAIILSNGKQFYSETFTDPVLDATENFVVLENVKKEERVMDDDGKIVAHHVDVTKVYLPILATMITYVSKEPDWVKPIE